MQICTEITIERRSSHEPKPTAKAMANRSEMLKMPISSGFDQMCDQSLQRMCVIRAENQSV